MLPVAPPSEIALDYLRRLVHSNAAIVLDGTKTYLFQARLTPIIAEEGLSDFDELVHLIDEDKTVAQRVVEAMTTNETSFFRDIQPFEALRKVILPGIAEENRARKSISIWSAASSTGQELYSIAFLVKEFAARNPGWSFRLMGTDISTEVLERAQAGRYSQLEVNRGLPMSMMVKHFTKVGVDWQVKADVRQFVEFKRMNLIEPWPPMPMFDVVFLRNVLIYFDVATRKRIIDRMADHIRPGGYLFLGGVETSMSQSDRLSIVQMEKTICYRVNPQGAKHVRAIPA